MRVNENIALIGRSVVLVPYRPEHVPTYHRWMSDPEMLRLTASEPLSLEEEHDMQRKWQVDDDKLTFIVLARDGDRTDLSMSTAEIARLPMIGDVNLFIKRRADDGDDDQDQGHLSEDDLKSPYREVECEVMIAESEYRGKSLGFAALGILLSYATADLGIPPSTLVARIGLNNAPSIALFQRLGFVQSKVVEVFGELEMRSRVVTWDIPWRVVDYT